MRVGGGIAGEKVEQGIDCFIGHALSGFATLAKRAKAGPSLREFSPYKYGIARAGGIELGNLDLDFVPGVGEPASDPTHLSLGDPSGESGYG
jgi:hypothetical protein